MIVYLDEAWDELKRHKPKPTLSDLHRAVMEGAVARVRPKMMTVSAITAGLLPIMWSHGAGGETMKRIAAPMVGGMISSTILTLIIIPTIFYLWRGREVEKDEAAEVLKPKPRPRWRIWLMVVAAILIIAAGWLLVTKLGLGHQKLATPILSEQVGAFKIDVFSNKPQLIVGENPIRIEVKDASGKPVDVGAVSLRLNMNMPGMNMQSAGVLKQEGPGVYSGTIQPGMGGEWIGRLAYDGPKGKEEKAVTVNIKQ